MSVIPHYVGNKRCAENVVASIREGKNYNMYNEDVINEDKLLFMCQQITQLPVFSLITDSLHGIPSNTIRYMIHP